MASLGGSAITPKTGRVLCLQRQLAVRASCHLSTRVISPYVRHLAGECAVGIGLRWKVDNGFVTHDFTTRLPQDSRDNSYFRTRLLPQIVTGSIKT